MGVIALGVICIAGGIFLAGRPMLQTAPQETGTQETSADTSVISAEYACDGGKTIAARFINGSTTSRVGNGVELELSDGRHLVLPNVISADGARYAPSDNDQTIVFWTRGNGAFVTENGTTTFDNCLMHQNGD